MRVEMSVRGRIRAGDPEAFRQLFDDHARSVYNHGFRLTGDWSVAEDVVSLTFLEAWRLRDRVDVGGEAGALRPWLLGIATNVARNVRRATRRYAGALARLPPPEVVPDFAEEVAGRLRDRERLARVRTALAALRQPEREVLALCVWSGLDYAEAAAALGVPVGTVRSRLSRARTKLHKLVGAGRLDPPRGVVAPPGENTEPPGGRGQVSVDRTIAVRFAQENAR
ncbi:RNA polymerase sigma factor [Micromonospora narathiwatensis]|uniref:RNA polymerase sigma-70 factor, ECF subfamily n=1 Tax=Micromonospora narathiwatensis TaxID=299146 RepID=A0A1A8Z4Q4_9ACTN|nr:RNA polymerase sigma factor [Micromonospora narathiwatensis]SBT38837.1 RNA polymerase sigma-70 factor, ECF subfamily [Micromonospora narathiwatensis]